MSFKIAGSVALVTGANRGIGRAVVDALLAAGAKKVYAGARDTRTLQSLAKEYPGRLIPLTLDVTDDGAVRRAAGEAGDITLLINNAGVASLLGADFGDEGWSASGRQELEVNLFGALGMTQAFAPVLARNGGGVLANVISVAAFANFPSLLSYSASKAALHSLTQATRIRLKGQGTVVVGIYPGPVDTDMAEKIEMDKAAPGDVARDILVGIEAGIEEIFPDPVAKQLGASYYKDPKGMEQSVAAMMG